MEERFTRFERARIIGARALQISMGAPIIIDVPDSVLHDPVRIAEMEYTTRVAEKSVIPITVLRPEGGHRPPRVRKEITTGRALKKETPAKAS